MDDEERINEVDKMDQPLSIWVILRLPFYAGGFMALLIFPAAGDWRWLEGWLYVGSFALITGICYWIINQKAPRVLRNRMKVKKRRFDRSHQTIGRI